MQIPPHSPSLAAVLQFNLKYAYISKQTNEDTLPVHNFNVCFQVVYAFIYLYVVINFLVKTKAYLLVRTKHIVIWLCHTRN